MAPLRVGIIGGGLAGAFLGDQLSKIGHEIRVYDKRRGFYSYNYRSVGYEDATFYRSSQGHLDEFAPAPLTVASSQGFIEGSDENQNFALYAQPCRTENQAIEVAQEVVYDPTPLIQSIVTPVSIEIYGE